MRAAKSRFVGHPIDLDQAAVLYAQAVELAPDDFTILSALVDFHADMRHWPQAVRWYADGGPPSASSTRIWRPTGAQVGETTRAGW